jgi:hypothetical protein
LSRPDDTRNPPFEGEDGYGTIEHHHHQRQGGQATLPGLADFSFAGAWTTGRGALLANALSGKNVIHNICWKEGRQFVVPGPGREGLTT